MSFASQGRLLPFPPLDHLEGQGGGTLGGGGLEDGILHPLLSPPPLSQVPFPIPSYSPGSIKGKVLHGEVLSLQEESCRACSPLSGLLQLSFRSLEGSSRWRPASRFFVGYRGTTG